MKASSRAGAGGRNRARVVALLVVLQAGCSDGGQGASNTGTPLSSPTAFQIQGKLALKPREPSTVSSPPSAQDFLLFVDPGASTVVSFASGTAGAAPVTMKGASFAVSGEFDVGLLDWCLASGVGYSSFRFAADASAGTVTGTGKGTVSLYVGDLGFSYDAGLTFTGTRDVTGPALALPSAMDPFHPTDLRATRPLPSSATAQLVAGGDTLALAPIQGLNGFVVGFSIPGMALLRFGTAYDVVVTPWQDLVGNAGGPPGQLVTRTAPALVAQEGFEDPNAASGDGAIVDASLLPPITGQRSAVLWARTGGDPPAVPDSPHVSARLQVGPGGSVVRLSARPFGSPLWSDTAGVHMEAGVPGGAVAAAVLPISETLTTANPSGGVVLGDVRTIEIPLPAGVGSEVIVDLSTKPRSTCGLPIPGPVGYLIDDLRVE